MKTVICDIDGVLNYYPQTILDFAASLGYEKYTTLLDLKNNLSFIEYNELKKRYRKSEYKHNAIIRDGAKELLQYFKEKGYFIILLTARECNSDMVQNTCKWLKQNDLYFDYIYFSSKKDIQIYQKFNTTEIVIDDSVNNLRNIYNVRPDIKFYLVDGNDNRLYIEENYMIRVNSLFDIINLEQENENSN